MKLTFLRTLILTWLLAGTLDAAAAIIQFLIVAGGNPMRVFEYIASGVFGQEAFAGNPAMAVWGITFHYFIALCWTVTFFVLYPRLSILRRSVARTGIAYGLVVWAVMNVVVLPLSNVSRGPFNPVRAILAAAILVACVGVPITAMAALYFRHRTGTPPELGNPIS